MKVTHELIAELEWANYAATLAVARVTPGLDITLRDDVIMTVSELFPTPDTNHACLVRSDAGTVDRLLDEITDRFHDSGLPATVFLSPACLPPGLEVRLQERGFVRQSAQEAWMVLDRLQHVDLPQVSPRVTVREIGASEAMIVARVFMRSFGIPAELAPYMAQLLAPSVGLATVHHYLALLGDQPAGTCSLLCYERYGVLGSAGVLPAVRGGPVATSLTVRAVSDARAHGIEALMLQTEAGTRLERLLRISGFVRVFTRDCYTLP